MFSFTRDKGELNEIERAFFPKIVMKKDEWMRSKLKILSWKSLNHIYLDIHSPSHSFLDIFNWLKLYYFFIWYPDQMALHLQTIEKLWITRKNWNY